MESAGYERSSEYDAPKQEGDSHFNKVLRFVFFDEYQTLGGHENGSYNGK